MSSADTNNAEIRNCRLDAFAKRTSTMGYAFPSDTRQWEQPRYLVAILSELGRKLLEQATVDSLFFMAVVLKIFVQT
jgi:hypothetical protein